MAVYNGNGGVSDIVVGYTDVMVTRKLLSTSSDALDPIGKTTTTINNVQVYVFSMAKIRFKCSYADIQNANICLYNNAIYVLDDFEQNSTNYGLSTWSFAPMLTFLRLKNKGSNVLDLSGKSLSTINVNCHLANYSELPSAMDKRNVKSNVLFNSVTSNDELYTYMTIRLALPPKMRNIAIDQQYDKHGISLPGVGWVASGDIFVRVIVDANGKTDTFGVSTYLMALASDPMYSSCVVDAFISQDSALSWSDAGVTLTVDDFIGVTGSGITMTAYIPKVLNTYKKALSSIATTQIDLCLTNLSIDYNGQSQVINCYDMLAQHGIVTGNLTSDDFNKTYLNVYEFPCVSSEGGKYVVALTYNNADITSFNKNMILAELSRPCIGLQGVSNNGASYWQNNKNRYELSQGLKGFESLFGVITSLISGSLGQLSAVGSGLLGALTQVLTKEAIIDDGASVSAGSAGAGTITSNIALVIKSLTFISKSDLQDNLLANPLTAYQTINLSSFETSTSPVYMEYATSPCWVCGVISVTSSYLTGYQKQKINEMLQQGVSINYNVGIGYQGA